jgi:hypothetical protein
MPTSTETPSTTQTLIPETTSIPTLATTTPAPTTTSSPTPELTPNQNDSSTIEQPQIMTPPPTLNPTADDPKIATQKPTETSTSTAQSTTSPNKEPTKPTLSPDQKPSTPTNQTSNIKTANQAQLLPRVLAYGAIPFTILATSVAIMLATTKPIQPKRALKSLKTQPHNKTLHIPTEPAHQQKKDQQNMPS